MSEKRQRRLFILIIMNVAILAVSLFYNLLFEKKLLSVFSEGCAFKNIFGFYCPGCGGSRALNALLNFRFLRSFIYYPAILYTALLILVIDIRLFISVIKDNECIKGFKYKLFIGVPIIIMASFLIKNMLLLCGIDLLEMGV